MTTRNDIIDGSLSSVKKYGLIYTKKCGWIDLGHANPKGAQALWDKIVAERDEHGNKLGSFRIVYSQMMGNKHVKVGVHKRYDIKKGAALAQKKSIALSIFLDVSMKFEALQGNWLFKKFTDSSFSAEDLVSNLVGFYRAVEPDKPVLQICEPVSKEIALRIWDKYGSVGSNKNHSAIPYSYPVDDSAPAGPMCGTLPQALTTIIPAKQGELFFETK